MPTTQLLLAAAWRDPRWWTRQWDKDRWEWCCASPQPPCRFRLFSSTQVRCIGIVELSTALLARDHPPLICAGVEVGVARISSEDKWVSVLYLLHSLLPPSTNCHEAVVVRPTIRRPFRVAVAYLLFQLIARSVLNIVPCHMIGAHGSSSLVLSLSSIICTTISTYTIIHIVASFTCL